MTEIILIAAIGKNRELGKENKLIWHLKKDLKFFKDQTMNHVVVMGYKTFLSLLGPLKGRTNIVLTHHKIEDENIIVFNDINKLEKYLKNLDEKVYVIGGESLYKIFLPEANMLLLTLIDDNLSNADTYFPFFAENKYNAEIIDEGKENNIKYKRVKYIRK